MSISPSRASSPSQNQRAAQDTELASTEGASFRPIAYTASSEMPSTVSTSMLPASSSKAPSSQLQALLGTKPARVEFIDFFMSQAASDSYYRKLNQLPDDILSANIQLYIDAIYPIDKETANGFALNAATINLMNLEQGARLNHAFFTSNLSPYMGISISASGELNTPTDFSLSKCPWLQTEQGRQNIVQVIRSLSLLGNQKLALKIRDCLVSLGLRSSIPAHKLSDIVLSCEKDFFARKEEFNKNESRANELIASFAFANPAHSIFKLAASKGRDFIFTGDAGADFLLGHTKNHQNMGIQDLLSQVKFEESDLDLTFIRALFPLPSFASSMPVELEATRETRRIFANSKHLRSIHRTAASFALKHFGLVQHKKFVLLANDFYKNNWAWLEKNSQGEEERGLLLNMIQSLYFLGNEQLADELRKRALQELENAGINNAAFETVSKLSLEKKGIVTASSVPTSHLSQNAANYVAQMNSQQIQAFIAFDIGNLTKKNQLGDIASLAFATQDTAAAMKNLAIFDDSIGFLLHSNAKLDTDRKKVLDRLIAYYGLTRKGDSISYTKPSMIAKELDFSLDPNSLAAIMTRVIEALTLSRSTSLANTLRNAAIEAGLRAKIDPITLAHWYHASKADYKTKASSINQESALKLLEIRYKQSDYRVYGQKASIKPSIKSTPEAENIKLAMPFTSPASKPKMPAASIPNPRQAFPFIDSPTESAYAQYLKSELLQKHMDNMFSLYADSWSGIAAWVFPIPEKSSANVFAPQLDRRIHSELYHAKDIQQKQIQVLDMILNQYGIQRNKDAILTKANFDAATNAIFKQGSTPSTEQLILTRIIRHLTLTGRHLLAQNLSRFLVSNGLVQGIAPRTLVHWFYAPSPNYDSAAIQSMDPQKLASTLDSIKQEKLLKPSLELKTPPAESVQQPTPEIPKRSDLPKYLNLTMEKIKQEAQAGIQVNRVDLNRFIQAQNQKALSHLEPNWELAMKELKAGKKLNHWIWYIFPQIRGLGKSSKSVEFQINSLSEAQYYSHHPELSRRLSIAIQLCILSKKSAEDIFGPDTAKFWASLTLFALAGDAGAKAGLQHFFTGVHEPNTKKILEAQAGMAVSPSTATPTPAKIAATRITAAPSLPLAFNQNLWSLANKRGGLDQLKIPLSSLQQYDFSRPIEPIKAPRGKQFVPNPNQPLAHVRIDEGNISEAKEDIVVNAANLRMRGGGGIDKAVHDTAGPSLLTELSYRYPHIRPNEACATAEACSSHSHNYSQKGVSYLIHVTGPRVWDYEDPEKMVSKKINRKNQDEASAEATSRAKPLLEQAYRNVLNEAIALNARSVSLPLLSAGVYGYPPNKAAEVALSICREPKYQQLEIVFYTWRHGPYSTKTYDVLYNAYAKLNKP